MNIRAIYAIGIRDNLRFLTFVHYSAVMYDEAVPGTAVSTRMQ